MALGQKEVSLKIKANTKKFQDEIKKLPGVTDKEAKKMAKNFARQFDKSERKAAMASKKMATNYKVSFAAMRTSAKTFAKFAGPALFAGAALGLSRLANSASEYTDKVMLMSKQTGMTAETLIGMEFAAQAAGSSIDEMKTGLNAFVMKAGQAANIGGASADVFERLGVSVKDTGGELRSTEDIFRDTITAISEMDTASEKATTAAELFGAKGAKIAAVFSDGTGALDEWAQKAKEAGIVMDGEALKASADMDRQMAELKLTMRGTAQEVGNTFIPAMILIAGGIGKVVSALAIGIGAIDNFMEAIMGIGQVSQNEADEFAAFEKAAASTISAVDALGDGTTMAGGQMEFATTTAARMRAGLADLGDMSVSLAEGTALTSAEYDQLKATMTDFAKVAQNLGIDFLEVKDTAKEARIETRELAESKLAGLQSELDKLGESDALGKTAKDAERATKRLADLNRSFELDALARVDEPLAKFEKEIDRVNAALLSGLDAQLGHDAIMDAIDDLNASRIEKEQEMQDKIAEVRDERRERDLKAEEESAKASQAMQEEFFSGTHDLANNVFEFAKNQRGITFEEEQALAIAQAIMNTAVGVTSALKKGVAGIPAALLVGAEGALQVAAIRSQTMHAGGMVGGTPDERPANLLTGEAVITRAGVDALGGSAGVNSINGGGGGAPQVIVVQYKHRVLDIAIKDQLRTDTNLNRALMGTGVAGAIGGLRRMGHR